MRLPTQVNEIPLSLYNKEEKVVEWYGNLVLSLIEQSDRGLTRKEIVEAMKNFLEDRGFEWDKYIISHIISCNNSCKKKSHETLYLNIHDAIAFLKMKKKIYIRKEGKKNYYVSTLEEKTEQETVIVSDELSKKAKEKIVEFTTRKYVETKSYKDVEIMFKSRMKILLKGKPGVGKTSDILHFAEKHNRKCFYVNFTEDTASWNLLGRSTLVSSYSDIRQVAEEENISISEANAKMFLDTWSYGVVSQACKSAQKGIPSLLLIDEINFASPSISAGILNPIINDGKLVIPDTGEVIEWDWENLMIGATMNPDHLVGTGELNEALESRLVKYEYDEPEYREIVKNIVGVEPSENICILYENLLTSNLSRTIGLREIIFWTWLEKTIAPLKRIDGENFHPLVLKLVREQLVEIDRDIVDGIITGLK